MSFDPDDKRITAFIFDELAADERTAFVAEMERTPELRQAVEETRQALDLLHAELADQPPLRLSDRQRESLTRTIDNGQAASDRQLSDAERRRRSAGPLTALRALAVSLLVVIGAGGMFLYSLTLRHDADTRQVADGAAATARREVRGHADRHADATALTEIRKEEIETLDFEVAELQMTERIETVTEAIPRVSSTSPSVEMKIELEAIDATAANKPSSNVPTAEELAGANADHPISGKNEHFAKIGDLPAPGQSVQQGTTYSFSLDENRGTPDGHRMAVVRGTELSARPDDGIGPGFGGDNFAAITENDFRLVKDSPLSTFSIDVDTASYAKVRMYLMQHNTMPRPDAVRIEELINYFTYDYQPPKDDVPFASHVEIATCPWQPEHRLVRVGIKGKEIANEQRPTSNLVFLLDVSGSMNRANKLPLLKRGMKMLVDQLGENDRVAIAVYAGAAGLVLPPTSGEDKAVIMDALDRLHAGGSTNGGEGIRLAYQTALDNFVKGGVNRVILCTDGDFNVGTTGTDELVRMAEDNAKTGVFLSVLGFGMGNHNDSMLEQISNKGNGNYAFVDTDAEARKVLVDQMSGTLVTIAKDVKIQIEFNPLEVAAYRLIGYENRVLAAQDFNDDKKDAGEIGAGHTVTALYEIVPAGAQSPVAATAVDDLRYQKSTRPSADAKSGELMLLKLRYKQPDEDQSSLLEFPIVDQGQKFGQASKDFRFAAAVASFGMLLRDSQYKGNATYAGVLETATESCSDDPRGYRGEFLQMVERAKSLTGR